MQVARNAWSTALAALIKREFQEQRLLFLLLPVGFAVLLQVFIVATLVQAGFREPVMVTLEDGREIVVRPGARLFMEDGRTIVVNASRLEQILVNTAFMPPEQLERMLQSDLEAPLALLGATYWGMLLYYFLMTLYHQRQNRSILFWSSMPVSNKQFLASKLLAAYAIAGGIYLLAMILMQLQMLLSIAVVGLFKGLDVWTLYVNNAHIFVRTAEYTVSLLMGMLWCLPVHGALLLASSWAKRAPFAWVAAGPVLLILVEQLIVARPQDRILMELIASHAFPNSLVNPLEQGLAEISSVFWSWELLLSVLLGCVFIALAIRFNRVDE